MKVDININGIELVVKGCYQPKERQSISHPEISEEFEIEQVFFNNIDVYELLNALNIDFSIIESEVLKYINKEDYYY